MSAAFRHETIQRPLRAGRALVAALVCTCYWCTPLTAWPGGFWSRQGPHPAVARITVPESDGISQGSGTLVAVRDAYGLVVTNWHVVRHAAGPITVTFPDGYQSNAQVLGTDPLWDLAALLIWRPSVQPVPLARQAPHLGEPLAIAGYGSGQYRLAAGRCRRYVAPAANAPYEMVEVSVPARQGDSGGPIFNSRGELAGVLFGADWGSTAGSAAPRVRRFLDTVWPGWEGVPLPADLARTSQPQNRSTSLAAPVSPSTAQQPADVPPTRSGTDVVALEPVAPATASVPEPTARSHTSPAEKASHWNADEIIPRLIGRSPWEQVKFVLAAIGLFALLSRLLGNKAGP